MSDNKQALNGSVSKQRNKITAANSEGTGSWEDGGRIDKETNLKIPGDYRVEQAKDWVDNGSRL